MTKRKWIPALIALCMGFSSTAISLPTMHNAMIAQAASGEWYDCFFFTVKDGEATIESCSGVGSDLVIPSKIRNYPVTGIGGFNDAAALQKWLLAVPDAKLADWEAADLCKDDGLDVFDLCMMKRELLKSN